MASLLRESHPLTLKVMRLSRPALAEARPLPVDSSASVLATPLREAGQGRPTQSGEVRGDGQLLGGLRPLDAFPLAETLVLPRSFGTMYLGEVFGAQLCVCNESALVVRDVAVRVVMQTATQQLALVAAGGTGQQLGAGQPLGLQATHEIKELGTHVLGCSIEYLSAQGERRTLQRSFRFQASNPLVVKTKVHHQARDVLLEVQVHNATHGPMALERLRLEPASPFAAEDLSVLSGGSPLWGSAAGFMQPGDVRQYLYRLRLPPASADAGAPADEERAARYAAALGRLDIVWRGAFGSVGRLQTSQLMRRAPGMQLLEVDRAWVVGAATAEEPLVARIRVRNASDREMAVAATVQAHRHPLVVPCGPARRDLGRLAAGEAREVDLQFVPLVRGAQRFGAMTLSDSLSGYSCDVDHVLDACLEPVGASCGFGVPLMEYKDDRPTLVSYAQTKSDAELAQKRVRDNTLSIDGIPSFLDGTDPGAARRRRCLAAAAETALPWIGGAALGAALALGAARLAR
ncbi:hypothetical protein IWQ57_000109 [Coemansia nantahalensis]|uniref:Uncharacterized protein n=2 Tax=Coemansia TaxID=4863 RepID=A0ACC1K9Q7_9FUNG|nr:hypothetical protein IWQ57_000109 [Coemansia nantahalensis]